MPLFPTLVQIEGLEAHVGRRGRIRVKGGLPLTADSSPAALAAQLFAAASQDGEAKAAGKEAPPAELLVDVHGLEMRVRNVYTGANTVISLIDACNALQWSVHFPIDRRTCTHLFPLNFALLLQY